MQILILSLADDAYADIAAISYPNKRRYADLHHYYFIGLDHLLELDRSPSWNKIPWLKLMLQDFDWIFWTDADSLIMNGSIRLEDVIGSCQRDLIFTQDSNGVNAGQFFIRNTDWAMSFLDDVWHQIQFLSHPWWEQAAIQHVLESAPEEHFLILPEKNILNSYHSIHMSDYQEGDFLVHFAGMGREHGKLRELMLEFKERSV